MTTLKSHKLLARPCPAAAKQEDCVPLKPHKLLTRSCSGDPRCEHGGPGLKPHKLLSRSYSSSLRVEELYGLRAHKLLGKGPASAPRSPRAEPFSEPSSEGRRLSLTSGLMGILTPSCSPSQPAVRNRFHPRGFRAKLRCSGQVSRDRQGARWERKEARFCVFNLLVWVNITLPARRLPLVLECSFWF